MVSSVAPVLKEMLVRCWVSIVHQSGSRENARDGVMGLGGVHCMPLSRSGVFGETEDVVAFIVVFCYGGGP